MHHDTDGGIDGVAFAPPTGAQSDAREPDRLRVDGREDTGAVRDQRLAHGSGREHAGRIVDHVRISPLRLDHPPEPLERLPRADRSVRLREGLVMPGPTRVLQGPGGEEHPRFAETTYRVAPEDGHGLRDVQGVPDRVAERLGHVRHRGTRRSTPAGGQGEAALRERPRVLYGLHEGARADLHVEEDQVRLHRQLLRHHAGSDQRDGRDGRRGVAQRVERAVGRHERGRLRGHRASHVLHLLPDVLGRQIRPHAGDRLELVERAARVSEPAARELRHAEPQGRGQRGEHERDAVGDPPGGVLVDGRKVRSGEAKGLARVHHRRREREGLLVVEPANQARHEERRRQRVGHVSRRVALDEGTDVSRRERPTVPLRSDDVARIVHGRRPIRANLRCWTA
jgi:hypothetical protein